MLPIPHRIAAAVLFCLTLPVFAQSPGCDMNELANLPVSFHGPAQYPTIPGSFDDKAGQVLLDIGKNESTLNKDGLTKLGFSIQSSSSTVPGIDLKTAHIKKLMVGQNTTKGYPQLDVIHGVVADLQGLGRHASTWSRQSRLP